MIVRRWIDARILVGGYDCSGDAGSTELVVNMEMQQATTLTMGCRSYMCGKISTSLKHRAFGGPRLSKPPDMIGVPVSIVTDPWCLFFLADRITAKRGGAGDPIEWVDIEAESESMVPPVYGRLGLVPFGNGQTVFSVLHDLVRRTSQFLAGSIPESVPDFAFVAVGTR